MANRKIEKWPIDAKLIMEMTKERGLSIRRLAKDPLVDRDERTLREYLKKEQMPPDILKGVAEVLKIDYVVLLDDLGFIMHYYGGKNMFIKLTSSSGLNEGKPIYVNMDRIVYFREMENPSQKGSFMVDATNEVIKVKEEPDEIVDKIVTFLAQETMAQNYVRNPFAYGVPPATPFPGMISWVPPSSTGKGLNIEIGDKTNPDPHQKHGP